MNHKKIKDLLHTNDYFYKTKTLELLSNKKYEILKNKAFKYQKTLNILTIIFLIISILLVSYIHYYLDNISVNGLLNTENNVKDIFSIYPNPVTNGYVNISSPSNGEKNIAVYDILGKQVMNTTITSDRLNVSQLNSGVYMLNISENGISSTKKLVIK